MEPGQSSQLECALCRGRLHQPKLLDCLHSFCADCLRKRAASDSPRLKPAPGGAARPSPPRRISCPLCRQETVLPSGAVDGLKTNVYLLGLVDEMVLQEQVARCGGGDAMLPCGSCEGAATGNAAAARCMDCALYLCASCQRAHARFAALSSHNIATLDEIRRGVAPAGKVRRDAAPKCRRHYGETLAFLCDTCQVLICRDCTLVDHSPARGHAHLDVDTAFDDRKRSLGELFPALHYSTMLLEESAAGAGELVAALRESSREAARDIRRRAAEARDAVSAEEDRMIEEVQRIRASREAKIQEFARKANGRKERIQHSLATARNLAATASKTDFLSLHATITKELKQLAAGGKAEGAARVDPRLGSLRFDAADGRAVDLGALVTEGRWELLRHFGQEGGGQGDFSCARGIAALPCGDLAVADQWNKRVVICGTDGAPRKTIPTEDYPFDVATFNRQLIVIDTTSYVKVFASDGAPLFDFPTVPAAEAGRTRVNLASIAVRRDGTVVVGDVHRRVLTEHRPADGSLIRTLPVDTPPHYLAVDSATGRLLVSGADARVADALDADAGATFFSVRPRVSGERVEYCSGVCSDGGSGLFLAMHSGSDSGHVHHYDARGKFRACVARDLHYPMSVRLCAGGRQLAVADWTSVKIFQLENI